MFVEHRLPAVVDNVLTSVLLDSIRKTSHFSGGELLVNTGLQALVLSHTNCGFPRSLSDSGELFSELSLDVS